MISLLLTFIDDERNKEKLSSLYFKYSKLMKRIAFEILSDMDMADDAVEDAFLKLIRHIDKLGEVESNKTKTFVIMTVKSTSIDIIRKRKEELVDDINDLKDSFYSDDLIEKISVSELKTKISELPEVYREVLMLKVYYEFTDREIAAFYKISYSAVRKRLERARKALLKSIDERMCYYDKT